MKDEGFSQTRVAKSFLIWPTRWIIICISLAMLVAPCLGWSQDTAYPPQDAQIPGPSSPSDFPAWLADLKHWRSERLVRMGYDDANYKRPELQWTQHNFVCVQMMVEERDFFDRERGIYTVDRYLDGLDKEFGGIDSVLIWDTYPNLGVDNRNQFDRLRDLPGGVPAVKRMVADFHRRGVKVLFPETPWDMGTRNEGSSDWVAQAKLIAEVGADGILGDTMDGVPHAFLKAAQDIGTTLALQPEGLPPEEALAWNEMSWGYWSYPFVPMISRYKWLETRHMPVLTSGGRHHIPGIQAAFFNGVGYADQEDVIGIHNGFTPREDEALRRVMRIERAFPNLLVSPEWEPHTPTLQYGIFASKFPGQDQTLWTIINRNEYKVEGKQIQVPYTAGTRYFDLWQGTELKAEIDSNPPQSATLNFSMEPEGFAAILATRSQASTETLQSLLHEMHTRAAKKLADYDDRWNFLPQHIVEIPPTAPANSPPEGMILIPGGQFTFKVKGLEVAGKNDIGIDVQYPWEDSPRRFHDHVLTVKPFYMDRYPVTNEQYKRFLEATHYHPADDHNFLRDWHNGSYPEGWADKPVTWVSLEDARAYARWAGKRLPHEWEWQYAAQGDDSRLYPWGDQWNDGAVPTPDKSRTLTGPDSVKAHPQGASPFGVIDLVGNIWQWTDEFEDSHTRSAILRGGSYYQPQGSMWYFPQAYRLDEHGKYLLMWPSLDRSGTVGFRCVIDASESASQ
jgi:formylglycine-generating enzyme required for sulfatase activity